MEKWKRDIIKSYPSSVKPLFASSHIKAFRKSEKAGRPVHFKDIDDRVKSVSFRPATEDDYEHDEYDEECEDGADDETG